MRSMLRAMLSQAAGGGGGGGGCGVVLNTIYDDNFDCGSSIDTAGTRFSGANAWSQYHMASTPTQSGGLLALSGANYVGGGGPNAVLQSLPGGSGDWRFRSKHAATIRTPSFPMLGMILRESSTDNVLAGGASATFMEVHRINGWGNWTGTYSGGTTGTGGVGVTIYTEISRVSGNIEFRITDDVTDGEDLTTPLTTGWSAASHAQTADFTTAPDQWGICAIGDTATFEWVKKI